jgi:arylsulfatase A-like enzyme
VAAADRCLGDFVGYLKRSGLYDRSVVVLTADHGESLGEDGRWGHGNVLHPELMRIPLIIHLPAQARSSLTADRSQVALSTDITPTLYALAGHQPRRRNSIYGEPLFVPKDQPTPVRRRESFLLSSSYGPRDAMLRHKGRTLYIADGVQGRDFAYEMGPDGEMARQTVTDVMRVVNRTLIREQIGDIAAEYRFSPAW